MDTDYDISEIKTIIRSLFTTTPWSDHDLDELIKGSRSVFFKSGETIISEGDIGHAAYIILSGEVNVLTVSEDSREVLLNTLGVNEYFGAQALLPGTESPRRSATVTAAMDSCMLEIPLELFRTIIMPIYRGIYRAARGGGAPEPSHRGDALGAVSNPAIWQRYGELVAG